MLLKTLATLVLEGREEIEKEEEAVKGETRRVSFEEKNVRAVDRNTYYLQNIYHLY